MILEDGYVDIDSVVAQYEYTEEPMQDFDDVLIYNPETENEDD